MTRSRRILAASLLIAAVTMPAGDPPAVAGAHSGGRSHGAQITTGARTSYQPLLVPQLGHREPILGIAVSADGRLVASAARDGVLLWHRETGRQLRSWRLPCFSTVAMSPDGELLAVSRCRDADIPRGAAELELRSTTTGSTVRRFEVHESAVYALAFSADGEWLATGARDGTVRVWDVRSGERLRQPGRHQRFVRDLAFDPTRRWLASTSRDGVAIVWDLERGTSLQEIEVGSGGRVGFSTDGDALVLGSHEGPALLLQRPGESGADRFELTAALDRAADGVEQVQFIGAGRLLAGLGPGDEEILTWDTSEVPPRPSRTLGRGLGPYTTIATVPGGDLLLAGTSRGSVLAFDTRRGELVSELRGTVRRPQAARWSPDGAVIVAVHDDGSILEWSMESGRPMSRGASPPSPQLHPAEVIDADVVPGAVRLAVLERSEQQARARIYARQDTGELDGGERAWIETSVFRLQAEPRDPSPVGAALSPDATLLLTSHGEASVAGAWDVGTGERLALFDLSAFSEEALLGFGDGPQAEAQVLAFSRNGETMATGGSAGWVNVWARSDGALIAAFAAHAGPPARSLPGGGAVSTSSPGVGALAISPTTPVLASGGRDGAVRLWDLATGRRLAEVRPGSGGLALAIGTDAAPFPDAVSKLRFSPDGGVLAVGLAAGGAVELYRVSTMLSTGAGEAPTDPIAVLDGHAVTITSLDFAPDGRTLLSASADGSLRLWDWTAIAEGATAARAPLAVLASFDDGTWAVTDADGRYDAADAGDVAGLSWTIGAEPVDLRQLKERYWDPGLLAKLLGHRQEPLRDVETFDQVELFPAVELSAVDARGEAWEVVVEDRGGGIGLIRVLVNGKEVVADARGIAESSGPGRLAFRLDLADAPVRPGDENQIEVVAWNAAGYLAGRGLRRRFRSAGETAPDPHLYVIAMGVSDYAGAQIDLQFAAADALAVHDALEIGGRGLFGADRVHTRLLADVADERARVPGKQELLGALEELGGATKSSDVLVLYLAGHGVTAGEQYAYLTAEARSTDVNDPAVRARVAVTDAELVEALKRIPALKQVMVLDTCASGAFERLVESRSVSGDQLRALERLKDRTGFHVLMGSAADAVSYEASSYGQGLLTYAFLEGLRGAALRDDLYADVSRLFQHAADRVPVLARQVGGPGGIQQPRIAAAGGNSFDIGRFPADVRDAIRVASPRPVLLRPNMLNRVVMTDDLALGRRIHRALRERTAASPRGGGPPAVYLDARELPGAVQVNGLYEVDDGTVRLSLALVRDGEVIESLEIDGATTSLDALAERVAALVLGRVG